LPSHRSKLQSDKIFIGNILRDLDIQTDDVNDLARKFMGA